MSSGPQRLGKYELQQRLGRGGMAEVWKALDTQLQRYVAIKFLRTDLRTDSDFMVRFTREAQAIASLRHPHIIQIHDFQTSTETDTAYMVMNYIEGPTLAEYIRDTSRQGHFPPAADIVYLFNCVSSAIDYAHQRGMVHRDIKPSNIMLDRRNNPHQQLGYPILMDFGIVKMLGSAASTLTGTGTLLGTPHYMSPEQARGQAGNERSDIYSLGVILYEICTGVRPFQGDNPTVIMMQHLTAMPTPPALINPSIPPALTEVILRSLAKNPAERFPNALVMAQALAQAINPSGPPSIETKQLSEAQQKLTPLTPSSGELPSVGRLTPSAHSLSGSIPTPYATAPLTPNFALSTQTGQHTPATATSTGSIPPGTTNNQSAASLTPVLPPPSPLLPETSIGPKRRKKGFLILLGAAILVVVAASLGSFYLLAHPNTPPVTANPIVGQVSFFSSTPDNTQNSSVLDDELQINLSNIASPASGKSYYGWLLSDEIHNPFQSYAFGPLPFDNGIINFHHFHDTQHTNLLATYSQFLITEENTNSNPTQPSLDKHTWHYYAELPQMPDNGTNQGVLTYIRNLLVQAGTNDIQTGVDIQFLRNTYQVSQSASAARTAWDKKDIQTLRTQLIILLDYIDGTPLISQDAPNARLLVEPSLIQEPLAQLTPTQDATSLIARVSRLLNRFPGAPGVTPAMTTLVSDALAKLPDVQDQLQNVHTNAVSLMKMSDTQLLSSNALTILNTMEDEANQAYNQIDSTYQLQGGALWIHARIQNLANLQVKKYA